ncbi:MAG: hypothetical protein OXI56_01480 [bacterium]|nr:hypothetical protein [bacterium]MDE0600446.1 hypothetical protein [bacterium]
MNPHPRISNGHNEAFLCLPNDAPSAALPGVIQGIVSQLSRNDHQATRVYGQMLNQVAESFHHATYGLVIERRPVEGLQQPVSEVAKKKLVTR